MSYIGSSAAPQFLSFSGVRSQSFNGDGTTTAFNLNRPVDSVTSVEVLVNNVQQSPFDSSYSVSGSTLTFSEAPSAGTGNVYVIFRDAPLGSLNPLDGSVTTDKIVNGAVTAEKIAAGAIPPSDDASALTTGTLPIARIADGSITNAKLAADGFDAGKFTTGTLPIARVADGAVTAAKLASTLDLTGKTVTLPAGVGGKVLQVVQGVLTGAEAISGTGSFGDFGGLTATITPSSASSKIEICVSLTIGTTSNLYGFAKLKRNSTDIAIGDSVGSRNRASFSVSGDSQQFTKSESIAFSYLDSPATTSATTYKLAFKVNSGQTLKINTSGEDEDGTTTGVRAVSTIILREISA